MTHGAMQSQWWQSFFQGHWSEIVAGMKPEDVTAEEAAFVRHLLDLSSGQKVLDVPCGNGRIGVLLAEFGCEVVGVELQPALVEEANREAARLGVPFTARGGDMRDLPWFEEFDAAFCFWTSFGYLDEAGDREFLEAVWRCLTPGAPFLLETMNIETILPGFLAQDWFRTGDWLVLEERDFDHVTSRMNSQWTFIKDGVVQQKQASLRLYTYRELTDLLGSCGFDQFTAYDTLTRNSFSMDASRLSLVARKQA